MSQEGIAMTVVHINGASDKKVWQWQLYTLMVHQTRRYSNESCTHLWCIRQEGTAMKVVHICDVKGKKVYQWKLYALLVLERSVWWVLSGKLGSIHSDLYVLTGWCFVGLKMYIIIFKPFCLRRRFSIFRLQSRSNFCNVLD